MSDDEKFTGEFTANICKNFKIPRKATNSLSDAGKMGSDKSMLNDIIRRSNPPPPGTTDLPPSDYVSPLATVYTGSNPYPCDQSYNYFGVTGQFDQPPPPPPPPPLQEDTTATTTEPAQAPRPGSKRRSLYTLPTTDGLPTELTKLILPLCCELCATKVNSPISAKMHYESKNHERKVNAWLVEWSARTGEPLPKRQDAKKGPVGPNAFHCDICDLPFTSLQHANQHYMGKKHRQVLAGRGKPRGGGYYENDKWIRTGKAETDPSNRFFIGQTFLRKDDETGSDATDGTPPGSPLVTNSLDDAIAAAVVTVAQSTDEENASFDIPKTSAQRPANTDPSKYCEICNISVTSEIHMKLHLNGQKHAKKLRLLGAPPHADENDTVSQCIMSMKSLINPAVSPKKKTKPNDNGVADGTASSNAAAKCDYSVYRTPSGQYYCQVCDITVVSEVLLSQHFESKQHYRNAATNKKK